MIERKIILDPSKPVNRSIPAEIIGTPRASDVAAPPSKPKINKISTIFLIIYPYVLLKLVDKLD